MVESGPDSPLRIWLTKTEYSSNEFICGFVEVEEDMSANKLELIFRGYEETRFWRKLVKQQKRYLVQDIKRRDFVRHSIELGLFQEGVAVANIYPFSIKLPAESP